MSAMLLPMKTPHEVDWAGFTGHLARTVAAGLTPAVNMDTGYANLIPDAIRQTVLERTAEICGAGGFVAGAYVADAPDAHWNEDAYRRAVDDILARGGLPIIFQSYGLAGQDDEQILRSYERLGAHAGPFLAFELGTMFAPFGKIYSLDLFRGLLGIEQCIGAKHSSLCRAEEWERLRIRDAKRPDFMLLTGNDLAIDMVMYGSDYLLGLSTFDPLAFALRDRYWEQGDPRFYELNDWLQYLGMLVFRAPVPGYKHNAAQFLTHRGWIENPIPYAGSPLRPASDLDLLKPIATRLEQFLHAPEQPTVTAPDP